MRRVTLENHGTGNKLISISIGIRLCGSGYGPMDRRLTNLGNICLPEHVAHMSDLEHLLHELLDGETAWRTRSGLHIFQ